MNIDSSVLVVLLVNFVLEDAALLGCGLTTNQSSIAIEVLGDFLKGSITGFDVEEVDEDKFEAEPDALSLTLAFVFQKSIMI